MNWDAFFVPMANAAIYAVWIRIHKRRKEKIK